MGQSFVKTGIIKPFVGQVSIQACKAHDGYCITAIEIASDASDKRHILVHLDASELEHFIDILRGLLQ